MDIVETKLLGNKGSQTYFFVIPSSWAKTDFLKLEISLVDQFLPFSLITKNCVRKYDSDCELNCTFEGIIHLEWICCLCLTSHRWSLVICLRWLLIHSGVCWHPRALLPSLLNMVPSAKCIVSMIVNFSMYRSIFIKTKCIRCKIIMRKENRTPCLYSLAFSFYFHHTSFRAFDMFLLFNSLIIWEEE